MNMSALLWFLVSDERESEGNRERYQNRWLARKIKEELARERGHGGMGLVPAGEREKRLNG